MATVDDKTIKRITANLREFGYSVTEEYVRDQVEALERGEKPKNVIAMSAHSMLTEAGLL